MRATRRVAFTAATRALVALSGLVVSTASAPAQDTLSNTAQRPRVGLVLSGGSAKGFAHIGVIAALEKLGVPIDVVTGTSMGSAIGGFYAIGYSPRELREIAANQDWSRLLSDRRDRDVLIPDRREVDTRTVISFPLRGGRVALPSGIVRGDAIMRLLERVTWRARGVRAIMRLLERVTWRAQAIRDFTRLPLPFSAVATDVETGEAVVLSSGVLAHAIRASMAITGVIQPIRLNNRLLMDGGVARNLPAQDARALGADLLICSDVSGPLQKGEELRSLFDIVFQTVAFTMAAHNEEQRRLCDVLIQPNVEGLSTFSFVEFDDWIARGEAAATEHADTLRAIAAAAAGPRDRSPAPLLPDTVSITAFRVIGVTTEAARNVVWRALDLRLPGRLSARAFDRALSRLTATNLFSRVTYRIDVGGPDTVAVVEVDAQPQDQIGLAFRYDDHRKAALLFTGTLHNLLQYGSTLDADLRLGEPTQLGVSYLAGRGIVSDINVGAEARYTRALLDIFEGGERVADVRTGVATASAVVGRTLSRTTVAGLRAGVEHVDTETRIAETDTAGHRTYYTAAALLWRDTFDRTAFPTRGISLRLRSVVGNDRLGGHTSFVQHLLDVEQLVPLSRRTVLRLRGIAGGGSGDDLPLHRQFFLGGIHHSPAFPETQPTFWGLEPQERAGTAVQVARVSLQREILRDVFATVGVNVGNAFERWAPRDFEYIAGWAASLGIATPIGPLEATVSGRNLGEWPTFSLNIGPTF